MITKGVNEITEIHLGEPIENFSPFSDVKDYSSTNHYYMSCSYPTETLALTRLIKVIVESSTRRSGGDSYVEFSITTDKGTKLSKSNMISEGTLIENGTIDGIDYKLTGQGGNDLGRYTVEFNEPIKLSAITGGCGSGVGQWRDTDRMKITVSGEKTDGKRSRIVAVMLGDKEIYGGSPQMVSGTFSDTSGVKLTLELDFKAKAFVRTTTKSSGVSSVLSHDVYLEYSDDNSSWVQVCKYHTQYWAAATCYAISNTKHKYWRVRFGGGNNQGNQEVILGNEKAMADVDFSGYTKIDVTD